MHSGGRGPDYLTLREGTDIKWRNVAMAFFGSIAAAWGIGISTTIDATSLVIASIFQGIGNFYADVVAGIGGIPTAIARAMWASAIAPIEGMSSLATPVIVLAIALTILAIARWS